jgi:hypothetical protein
MPSWFLTYSDQAFKRGLALLGVGFFGGDFAVRLNSSPRCSERRSLGVADGRRNAGSSGSTNGWFDYCSGRWRFRSTGRARMIDVSGGK